MTRRDFVKTSVTLSVLLSTNAYASAKRFRWSKSLCNLCPMGCELFVATEDEKIVALRADENSRRNHGLLCSKGYFNLETLYSEDRLGKPLLRVNSEGYYDKKGEFQEVSWARAFQEMKNQLATAYNKHGLQSIGFLNLESSVESKYALNKLVKAGFRTNNIVSSLLPNAKEFIETFGDSDNASTLDDIEKAQTILSFGLNLTQAHPMVTARILDARFKHQNYQLINISTIKNDTAAISDVDIRIKPDSDLTLLNYLAHEIFFHHKDKIDNDFIHDNTIFATNDHQQSWMITSRNFKTAVSKYDMAYVIKRCKADQTESDEAFKAKIAKLLERLLNTDTLSLVASSSQTKEVLRLHLLLGKYAKEGNSVLNLAGKLGSSFFLGANGDDLPAFLDITRKKDRNRAEEIWGIEENSLSPEKGVGYEELFSNTIKFLWIMGANPASDRAHINADDKFVITSDVYPTLTARQSDLILPSAMIYEKFATYINLEGRVSVAKQIVPPYKEALSELMQIVEFSKMFSLKELWGSRYAKEERLFDRLFASAKARAHQAQGLKINSEMHEDRELNLARREPFRGYGFFIQKYLFEEFRDFGLNRGYDLAPYRHYLKGHALKYPTLEGKETLYRFNAKYDLYAKGRESGYAFYAPKMKSLKKGDLDGLKSKEEYSIKDKAKIFFQEDSECFEAKQAHTFLLHTGRALEHTNSGVLTFRVPELFKALPEAMCYVNKEDFKEIGFKREERVYLQNEFGKIKARIALSKNIQPARGELFIPSFDSRVLVNHLTNGTKRAVVRLKRIV